MWLGTAATHEHMANHMEPLVHGLKECNVDALKIYEQKRLQLACYCFKKLLLVLDLKIRKCWRRKQAFLKKPHISIYCRHHGQPNEILKLQTNHIHTRDCDAHTSILLLPFTNCGESACE